MRLGLKFLPHFQTGKVDFGAPRGSSMYLTSRLNQASSASLRADTYRFLTADQRS